MLWILLCIGALAALILAEYRQDFAFKFVAKLLASTAFVAAALAWGAVDYSYGRWMLAGLLLCWLGDVLLLPEGSGSIFLAGLLAFLFGHLSYAAAFLQLPLNWLYGSVALILALISGAMVFCWLWSSLPKVMRVAVPVYMLVIFGMVVLACAASGAGAPAVLAIGAAGFATSDLAVARERFIVLNFANRAWGLPAYYFSQLLLAYSIYLVHNRYLPDIG